MDSDVLYSTIDIRDSGSGIQHLGGQRGRELGVTSLSSFSFAFFFLKGGGANLFVFVVVVLSFSYVAWTLQPCLWLVLFSPFRF